MCVARPDPDVRLRNAGAARGFLDRRFEPCDENPVDIDHGESLLAIGEDQRRGLHPGRDRCRRPGRGSGSPSSFGLCPLAGKCRRARLQRTSRKAASHLAPVPRRHRQVALQAARRVRMGGSPGTTLLHPTPDGISAACRNPAGTLATNCRSWPCIHRTRCSLTCLRFGINRTPETNAILADPRSLPELLGTARRPHRGETNPQGQMSPTARAAREPALRHGLKQRQHLAVEGIRKDRRSAPGPTHSTVTQAGGNSCRLRARTSPIVSPEGPAAPQTRRVY